MLKLNLGASDRHVRGFTSVDLFFDRPVIVPSEAEGIELANLDYAPWPWPDSSVDEIIAFDIIEHLGNRIQTMNELHRVLKPGATVRIEVPNASKGAGFFQDPTHRTPWVMNSFQYFEHGSFAHQRFAKSYGITAAFEVLDLHETSWQDKYEITWKIHATLKAVK